MPAGKPWLTELPALRAWAPSGPLWHVWPGKYDARGANRFSKARLALVDGAHGMYYVATDLAGALWETVLRKVEPDKHRHVQVQLRDLDGQCAVQLRLKADHVPLLELGQPGLRQLFAADTPESVAVARLLTDPVHANTHLEARQLAKEFGALGMPHMPVLSWPSRQHNASTVYLAYDPPMTSDWWELASDPIRLDDPATGHVLIQDELRRCGFYWTPLATTATPPGDP